MTTPHLLALSLEASVSISFPEKANPVNAEKVALGDLVRAGRVIAEAVAPGVRRLRMLGWSWRAIAQVLDQPLRSVHRTFRYLDELPVVIVKQDGHAFFRCSVTGVEVDPREEGGDVLAASQLRDLGWAG